ncbi:insulinase family protein [Marinomonas sp. THO17]|uniref:insulinase family protein n=1 Tax=Marinomonas sp. THO17 TaxID=3149048 RepID=UPI00336C1582
MFSNALFAEQSTAIDKALAQQNKVSASEPINKSNKTSDTLTANTNTLLGHMVEIPHKSRTDQNQYHFVILENQLKVLLVSDPQAEKFSASLSVNVGNFADPETQPGLAHLLEHMLFLGTQKYPKSGDYQYYIHNNAGTHNAYTSTNTTNYFFDVKPSAYEGALDRFSQFFIHPLFSEALTQREKNAVDAEYKAKIKTDSRRNNQALKTLINPQHPYSRFSVGNLKTLKDQPGKPLRQQLLKLYQQEYYANNMALVLVANLNPETLAKLAQHYFSDIPTSASAQLEKKQYPDLIQPDQAQLQFVRSLSDHNSISFNYQIPAQNSYYKTQPTRYLSYILGNENQHSLYANLKAQDLITGISATTSKDYGHNAFFTVKIHLTNKGMSQIDEVAKQFFATISLLKSSPVNSLYLEEGLKLSRLMFNNQGYIQPIQLARALSSRLLRIPAMDLLGSFRVEHTASAEEVHTLLDQLTPQHLLIQIASQQDFPQHWAAEVSKWQKETYYDTQYSNHFFSQDLIEEMNSAVKSTLVSLPQKNVFIPDSLALIKQKDDLPEVVYKQTGFQFWNKSDPSFNKPTAMHFLAFRFDHAADTPKHMLANRLWTRLFNNSISEATYSPYVAGLGYSFYPHANGVTLRTNGYSDKQGNYLVWLVDQLFLYRPDAERFKAAKLQLAKDLLNQANRQAFRNANTAFNTLITKNSFTKEALTNALKTLTFEDFVNFIKHARESFNLLGYSTGNITSDDTKQLANKLYERFTGRLIERAPIKIETKTITPLEKLHYRFQSNSDDKVILYTLIDTSHQQETERKSIQQKCYFTLLNKLIKSAFYQELRTDKQLGYIVGTQDLSVRNTPILGLLVQSPNKSNQTIIKAIEDFLNEQKVKLKNLSDEDFHRVKEGMLLDVTRKAKNLAENALKEWHQIAKSTPNFKTQEEWINSINRIKKDDFMAFLKEKIESNQTTRILVHNQPMDNTWLTQHGWQETSATNQSL